MWEEDPKWQESNYRLLVFLVVALTVGVAVWSAWAGEWKMLGCWLLGLAVVFLAFCLYAVAVKGFAHSVIWIIRVYKRVIQRK